MKKKGKRRKEIMMVVISLVFVIYIIMYISVLPVAFKARSIFLGLETTDDCLKKYERIIYDENIDVNITLIPYFVLHNFQEGTMWVYYSYEVHDENGSTIQGSWGICTKWYIKRVKNEWKVVDIIEAP